MPTRKEEEPETFKVVDRRAFTSEGERRAGAPEESTPPEKPPRPAAETSERTEKTEPADTTERTGQTERIERIAGIERTEETEPPPPAPGSPPEGPGVVRFDHLIMSLVTTAMFQLGMAAQPGAPPPPPDLPAAQETIDLLALLQQKTKGNLTREEDELLAGSLQELRLAFVELARRAGRIR